MALSIRICTGDEPSKGIKGRRVARSVYRCRSSAVRCPSSAVLGLSHQPSYHSPSAAEKGIKKQTLAVGRSVAKEVP